MTIRPIPCFEVVCDEPDCGAKTGDFSDFSGWGDEGYAEEEWTEGNNQVAADGKHYCYKHAKPACVDCRSTVTLTEDEPDGDLYCAECMPTVTS